MHRGSESRQLALGATLLFLVALAAPRVEAFEAMDGRLQLHGFFESQLRFLSKNYAEQWDMAQWYNILNLELELDIIDEEPLGPVDLLSGFIRLEGRYDCIYSQGCGMMQGWVNTYGNKAESLPRRLNYSEEIVAAGSIWVKSNGRVQNNNLDPLYLGELPGFRDLAEEDGPGPVDPSDPIVAGKLNTGQLEFRFVDADRPKPWDYVMDEFKDWQVGLIDVKGGGNNGNPNAILGPWLPKNTIRTLNGAMTAKVNPMDSSRKGPVSLQIGSGSLPMRPIPIYNEDESDWDYGVYGQDNPARGHKAGDAFLVNRCDSAASPGCNNNPYRASFLKNEGRGLYYPSQELSRYLNTHDPGRFDYNISEINRSFNHGAGQNQTGELKEAYLDIEMFDSRLWLRLGKQTIVWGKTELFPTVDQWNPQDLALGSLTSLEESRLALWAVRGIYSFYELGPLEDFRLEVAFNLDEFQPADLGACGEPYTINLVCGLPLGSWAHGVTGIGLANIEHPPDPWEDISGLEIGARIEFRWDRYSFSISDWWGYNDFPSLKRLSTYERNVDPNTGRPRIMGAYTPCTTQDWLSERGIVGGEVVTIGAVRPMDPSCLRPGPQNLLPFRWRNLNPGFDPDDEKPGLPADRTIALQYKQEIGPDGIVRYQLDAEGKKIPNEVDRNRPAGQAFSGGYIYGNALDFHHANQTLFGFACGATVGGVVLDPATCGLTVFSSKAIPEYTGAGISVVQAISSLIAGNPTINGLVVKPDPLISTHERPLYFVMPLVQLHRNLPRDVESFGCVGQTTLGFVSGETLVGCGGDFLDSTTPTGGFGMFLTPEQEALLGCGPLFNSDCRFDGIDLLNADASALLQAFIGADNANSNGRPADTIRTDNRYLNEWDYNPFYDPEKEASAPADQKYRYAIKRRFQPGTLDFMLATTPDGLPIAGPVCTTGDLPDGVPFNYRTGAGVLPGCRWNKVLNAQGEYVPNAFYDPNVDGDPTHIGIVKEPTSNSYQFPEVGGANCLNSSHGPYPDDLCTPVITSNSLASAKGHPFTGDQFASEIAAISYNFQTMIISFDDEFQGNLEAIHRFAVTEADRLFTSDAQKREYIQNWKYAFAYTGTQEAQQYLRLERIPYWKKMGEDANGRSIFLPEDGRYLENSHCSYITPQFCDLVQSLLGAAGQKRNTLEAGGNGVFGRRTFAWHSGGEVVLRYDRRNVLGFAMDFAEDRTKSNWGIEATWIQGVKYFDNNARDNISESDEFNLTVAMDRPSFFNFLNPNRTFFITSQWFFSYKPNYQKGFTSNGPWNVLGMLFLQTGYFQDRLVANTVFLYDVQSNSGGILASVLYRISENFSVTIGLANFMGRQQYVDMPVNGIGPTSNRLGPNAYRDSTENLISAIRDRDEAYLRLRYTF